MDQEQISQTTLDQMVSNDKSQMLKAAVPYLPPKGQQILSLYAKVQELKNTIELFSDKRPSMEICTVPTADPMEILQGIRRFSYGDSAKNLNQLTNIMALVEMLKIMNESS